MQKIILDTNVVISSLLQRSYPFFIVQYCLNKRALLCLSKALLKEYLLVVQRPKFSRYPDFLKNAEDIIIRLSYHSEFYEPKEKIDIIADDPDNRLLELANESKADYIITGNHTDFNLDFFKKTLIVSPKEYWLNHSIK